MDLVYLAIVGFIQNMAFTWSSRSRNSGNPLNHFFVANLSNGIWFICNFFLILPRMLEVINNDDLMGKVVIMSVYIVSTSLGSAVMMKILLKTEKGKNKVGAR